MTENLKKVLKVGDKDVTVEYRNLKGREPLDIQDHAMRMDMRTKDLHVDTGALIWERLRARVLKIDGADPVWDEMDEELVFALTAAFGIPKTPPN